MVVVLVVGVVVGFPVGALPGVEVARGSTIAVPFFSSLLLTSPTLYKTVPFVKALTT